MTDLDRELSLPPSGDSNRPLFAEVTRLTDEYAKPTLRDDMIDTAWQAIDDRTDYDAGPRELAATACDALYDQGYWSPAMVREQIAALNAIWPHRELTISILTEYIVIFRNFAVLARGQTYEEVFATAAMAARDGAQASRVMVAADLGLIP